MTSSSRGSFWNGTFCPTSEAAVDALKRGTLCYLDCIGRWNKTYEIPYGGVLNWGKTQINHFCLRFSMINNPFGGNNHLWNPPYFGRMNIHLSVFFGGVHYGMVVFNDSIPTVPGMIICMKMALFCTPSNRHRFLGTRWIYPCEGLKHTCSGNLAPAKATGCKDLQTRWLLGSCGIPFQDNALITCG